MSNRTIRRAAERAALKTARKEQRQSTIAATAVGTTATIVVGQKSIAATASIVPGDDEAIKIASEALVDPNSEASKSTGPRTESGREIASRNALKHGSCAVKTLILPNESRAEYVQLETSWFQTYRVDPISDSSDPVKADLIRTAARAEWFFKRSERNYSDVEAKLMTETPDMSDWTEDQHKKLGRVLRYRTANANILAKHRKDLETHIKARAAESAHYQKFRQNVERMDMAKERLEVFRQKNKPFDLAEELEAMKEKAIRLGFRQPDPEPAAD